jgi:hypothetical protein
MYSLPNIITITTIIITTTTITIIIGGIITGIIITIIDARGGVPSARRFYSLAARRPLDFAAPRMRR